VGEHRDFKFGVEFNHSTSQPTDDKKSFASSLIPPHLISSIWTHYIWPNFIWTDGYAAKRPSSPWLRPTDQNEVRDLLRSDWSQPRRTGSLRSALRWNEVRWGEM